MALISCPECGREKVSDNALSCPDCGFGIREHFQKVNEKLQISPSTSEADIGRNVNASLPAVNRKRIAKFSTEEIKEMERKADNAVKAMTASGVAVGFVPVAIDIAAFMASMGVGVVAIGKCFTQELTKEEAGDLIKQFFKAAGLTYSMIFVGQKLTASLLKSNPVTYVPMMISDAAMCGATAFAVGITAKKYFSRKAQGMVATDKEIEKWMKEGKKQGKTIAQTMAEEKAKAETEKPEN